MTRNQHGEEQEISNVTIHSIPRTSQRTAGRAVAPGGQVPLPSLPCPALPSPPQHSPLQLLQGHCDPQAMAQDIESGQDVCPLHHLPQRPALQHPWAEHVTRLLRQEANVNEDLGRTQGQHGGRTQGQHGGAAALALPPPGRPGQQQMLPPGCAWAGVSWHQKGDQEAE